MASLVWCHNGNAEDMMLQEGQEGRGKFQYPCSIPSESLSAYMNMYVYNVHLNVHCTCGEHKQKVHMLWYIVLENTDIGI